MIDFLIKMLPYIAPALRYADNQNRNYWRVDLFAYTIFVWLCDMTIAHLFFRPQKNEWTISHTLERTAQFFPECRKLALAINSFSAGHIKAVS